MILFQLFATGINDTSGTVGKICHRCRRWCTLTCRYLCDFLKKFKMTIILFSGAWGKIIHEKEPEAKNLVPLRTIN